MSEIEKSFDSIEESQQWLSTLTLQAGQQVKVIITSAETPDSPVSRKPKLKFSDTVLSGLWKDRQDMQDVERYIRNLRKPRYTDVS